MDSVARLPESENSAHESDVCQACTLECPSFTPSAACRVTLRPRPGMFAASADLGPQDISEDHGADRPDFVPSEPLRDARPSSEKVAPDSETTACSTARS